MLDQGEQMNTKRFGATKGSVRIQLGEERRAWLSQHPEMSPMAVQRVRALPPGVPDAAMERVARGAHMESRLQEHDPTGYALSEKDQKKFDNLMHSLFDLDGDRFYEVDIDTAIGALESFVGMPVGSWDLDKALRDMRRHDWARGYLPEVDRHGRKPNALLPGRIPAPTQMRR